MGTERVHRKEKSHINHKGVMSLGVAGREGKHGNSGDLLQGWGLDWGVEIGRQKTGRRMKVL